MDKPKKYVKKPVEVEAILFTENNIAEVMEFMNQSSYNISVYKGTNTISKITIPTLEGNLEATIGNYIIKGIKGEFYPCRKDIFDATYEEVKFVITYERRSKMKDIEICYESRGCLVDGRPGIFHCWEHWSNLVDASPMIGGHPGGQVGQVYGIVEFSDGVRRIDPTKINFTDEKNMFLQRIEKTVKGENNDAS